MKTTSPTEYASLLITQIQTSSLPIAEQEFWIGKIKEGTFDQKDLDHILEVLRKDLEAVEYAQKVMKAEDTSQQQKDEQIPLK